MGRASDADWAEFYARTAGRPPRPLFERLRAFYLADGRARTAIDLGCGDGTESLVMLSDGLAVTAIDGSPTAVGLLSARATSYPSLAVVQAQLEDVDLPEADLVYSGLTLPFCHPTRFLSLWARLLASVSPGGLVAVDLFGHRHGWVGQHHMTFLDGRQVDALVDGLEVLDRRESDEVRPAAQGELRRMHVVEVIARKPLLSDRGGVPGA